MRVTCHWSPGGTKTFRNKSGKIFRTFGNNLQNPSDRICRIHTADPGKILIQVDQAGAEALIVAYECRPGRFRDLFINSIKPHTFVALHLFVQQWGKETQYDAVHLCGLDIPILAVHPDWKSLSKIIKKNHERYFIGKKTCHSYNYCKSAASFRFDVLKESEGKVILSLFQSELFESIYHGLFPEIKEEQKRIEAQVRSTRTLRNLFGHPMHFGGRLDDKTIREAVAWKFQSTVGVIASNAFRDMQDYIEDHDVDWDVLNNKHDSVLIQSPESEWQDAARILRGYLEPDLVSTRGEEFKMKTEVSIGHNWGKHDEIENPEGMKEVELAS